MSATFEQMGELHKALTDDLMDYMKRTPADKRRVGRLTLARRLCEQSGFTINDADPATRRKLAKLYQVYVAGLSEQVASGKAAAGHMAEVGLLLRSARVDAQSAKAPAKALTLVPHQGLPFNSAGQPTGLQ